MSSISCPASVPLDADLAVVYLPLMAARLVEFLESRAIKFVHVPDE